MARRRNNFIVARSLTATTTGAQTGAMATTTTNDTMTNVQTQRGTEALPEYGQPTQGTDTALFGSVRPTFEIYPGE
ncbi:hypothetical protein [Heliorestis convoluta]|uniref:Uncharacterized protein n=1 Tax=Heliorestis convoluta TaxID=356322 RepID=A0A5Q2MWA8_9FIRM|nr:hypothetical protein [Heliorestis convoluta]QGG46527.1 hypothetical protein FTV88_0348 [Heliorestis convoluta]